MERAGRDYPAPGRARARQAAGRRRANMAVLPEKYVFVSKKCIVFIAVLISRSLSRFQVFLLVNISNLCFTDFDEIML